MGITIKAVGRTRQVIFSGHMDVFLSDTTSWSELDNSEHRKKYELHVKWMNCAVVEL